MFNRLAKSPWLVHTEWLILLFLFPFIVSIKPSSSWILLFVLAPLCIRRWRGETFVPYTPYNLLLLGLLIVTILSLGSTYSVSQSLRKVSSLIWGIFLFWGLQGSFQLNKQNKFYALGLVCCLGLTVSFVALFNPAVSLQILGGRLILNSISQVPGAAFLAKINPNEIGGILTWCLPISFSFSLALIQQKKLFVSFQKEQSLILITLLTIPLIPMVIILMLLSSRASLGGVFLAIGLIWWLKVKTRERKIIFGGFGIIFGLLLTFFATANISLPFWTRFNSSNDESVLNTLNGRVEIWSRALYGIQDFPLTGMGMNTFREVVHILYPLFRISKDTDIAHAHNQLLQVALDLGIFGLMLYMGVLILSATLLYRCWQLSNKEISSKCLISALSGALLASFVFGLVDAIALGAIPSFIFWILIAVIPNINLDNDFNVAE